MHVCLCLCVRIYTFLNNFTEFIDNPELCWSWGQNAQGCQVSVKSVELLIYCCVTTMPKFYDLMTIWWLPWDRNLERKTWLGGSGSESLMGLQSRCQWHPKARASAFKMAHPQGFWQEALVLHHMGSPKASVSSLPQKEGSNTQNKGIHYAFEDLLSEFLLYHVNLLWAIVKKWVSKSCPHWKQRWE